jgi:hypothetical protein
MAVHLDFVLVELDLGAAFSERALCTQDEETRQRNIRNAQRAYNSALDYLPRLRPESAELRRFEEKVLRLNGLFERLGLNPDQRQGTETRVADLRSAAANHRSR